MSLSIIIVRKSISLDYIVDPKAPEDYSNNNKNNMKDIFFLMGNDGSKSEPYLTFRCQTVANMEGLKGHPRASKKNTISPGRFTLRLFVEKRDFWPEIHGISDTYTSDHDKIRDDFTTATNPERWLMHDLQKLKPEPQGSKTINAWSDGCIVVDPESLVSFNTIVRMHYGKTIEPGVSSIPGYLILV